MNTLVFVLSFVICGLIQGLFSFGGGIIIMPILSAFFDLKNVIIPVFSLYNIFSNIYSYLNYRSINIFKYKKLLFYGFLGNIIGSTIIMVLFSTDSLIIILAIATIINIVFSSKIPKFSFDQH